MATAKTVTHTAQDLYQRLAERYKAPDWALLPELRSGTGGSFTRSADAIAMSLWPSRGLEVYGFEIKVSKSDWRKELASPGKADEFFRFCDRWYVVAPCGVVDIKELPPKWGLMVPRGTGLQTSKVAEELSSQAFTRDFVASLFRRAHELVANDRTVKQAKDEGYRRGFDAGNEAAVRAEKVANDALVRENKSLKGAIEEFERSSGVRISAWDSGSTGRAFKAFRQINPRDLTEHLIQLLRDSQYFTGRIEDGLKNWRAATEAPTEG